ncbi:MAG TPA: hypothetical protein PLD33_10325 [Anaerolineales bacterium]|nr:hypothetical protein [Anaerolineales bacterium]HNE67868.1 hypothetical protein [Anaerolineales bacterium]HNH79030.1 hypothetical protein [Anaerolineales bacterium]HNJ14940.1 hypothetical protein [Anaerolineales bacterium]
MNPLLEEYLVEEHQREIEREMNSAQLLGQTVKAGVYHPTLSTRLLRGFGQWMIEKGEDLVKRHEIPAQNRRTADQRYAH